MPQAHQFGSAFARKADSIYHEKHRVSSPRGPTAPVQNDIPKIKTPFDPPNEGLVGVFFQFEIVQLVRQPPHRPAD